jgi:hypothetical protein
MVGGWFRTELRWLYLASYEAISDVLKNSSSAFIVIDEIRLHVYL